MVREVVPARLFQTDHKWGALIATSAPDASGAEQPEYVLVMSEAVSAPQVLQRTTAPNMAEALRASSIVRGRSVEGFQYKLRLATSDRYAAQGLAERRLVQTRPGWNGLHLKCEVTGGLPTQGRDGVDTEGLVPRARLMSRKQCLHWHGASPRCCT